MRQQEAVSGLEEHRIGNALDRQPALAGDERVAFDAVMLGELNRQLSADIKATGG
jgi:hypothetical protein